MSGSKIPIRFKVHVCLNHTKDIYQDNSETEIKNILQYNYDNSTFQKPNHLKRAKHVPNFLQITENCQEFKRYDLLTCLRTRQ